MSIVLNPKLRSVLRHEFPGRLKEIARLDGSVPQVNFVKRAVGHVILRRKELQATKCKVVDAATSPNHLASFDPSSAVSVVSVVDTKQVDFGSVAPPPEANCARKF